MEAPFPFHRTLISKKVPNESNFKDFYSPHCQYLHGYQSHGTKPYEYYSGITCPLDTFEVVQVRINWY